MKQIPNNYYFAAFDGDGNRADEISNVEADVINLFTASHRFGIKGGVEIINASNEWHIIGTYTGKNFFEEGDTFASPDEAYRYFIGRMGK